MRSKGLFLVVSLASCLILAGSASAPYTAQPLLPTYSRKGAYNPSSFNVYDGAASASSDSVWAAFTITEDLKAYSSTASPMSPLFEGDANVELVWASSLVGLTDSWDSTYTQGELYRYSSAIASVSDLAALGYPRGSYSALWEHVLASGSYPFVGGYIKYGSYADGVYTCFIDYFGYLRPPVIAAQGGNSLPVSWWEFGYGSPAYAHTYQSAGDDSYFQYQYNAWSWHSRLCGYAPYLYKALYNAYGGFYDTGYNDGLRTGSRAVVSDDYNGLTYEQIYENGKQDGIAAGSPTMLNLYGMFAAVLTMPFTFMSTSFDSTLFEGTPYAFNVSVFLYSVFIVLIVWKILSLVFRGR